MECTFHDQGRIGAFLAVVGKSVKSLIRLKKKKFELSNWPINSRSPLGAGFYWFGGRTALSNKPS
jgi:hypothetical protein